MTIGQAIVMGAIQGITEFLPISSSGHLLVVPPLLGWAPNGLTFDVSVHVASLLAIALALPAATWRAINRPLLLKVLVATIPAVLVGLIFGDWLEGLRAPWVVGSSLIFWGVFLALAEWRADGALRPVNQLKNVEMLQAWVLGLAQPLAFIPGTSRSGVTMTVGMLSGLSKETAATFSFLMAIPAIAGAGAMTAVKVAQTGFDIGWGPLWAGAISAFISGLLAIKLLYWVIKRARLQYFAFYRIVFGILILWLL
jgi:undecaprenyl-diphosphatase